MAAQIEKADFPLDEVLAAHAVGDNVIALIGGPGSGAGGGQNCRKPS